MSLASNEINVPSIVLFFAVTIHIEDAFRPWTTEVPLFGLYRQSRLHCRTQVAASTFEYQWLQTLD